MSIKKISTVIFDAGGVLLYIKRKRNDIAKNLLLSMGYEIETINRALKVGLAFDDKYFSNQTWIYNWKEEKDWLLGHYKAIAKSVDEHSDYLGDKLFMLTFDTNEYALYPEVIDILETLKENYELGIISNALPSLDWSFDTLKIRKYFKNIIISAYEGVDKPDKAIYVSGVRKLGCKFEECIFIDDKIENVEAAESLGMKGFYLDRKKDTLKALLDILSNEFNVA
ncbi:MAG: HAD-IA family hydrolase [Clostridium sp.]|uniref:HAD-IA family hydrolase n=1 Tax=Clostridium sp. TaxID=1506 RepID=UPI003D6C9427